MSSQILATVLLEFNNFDEYYKAIHFLKDFIHHDIFYGCQKHDETHAFYFEHWARHNHYSKIPLPRPESFYE